MKKNRLIIVLLLFICGGVLNAKKIDLVYFEISPEANFLFFSDDLVGGKDFDSTQLRTSIGIGYKSRNSIILTGLELLTPMQLFGDDLGSDLSSYRFGIHGSGDISRGNSTSFLMNFGLGVYGFDYNNQTFKSTYFSLRIGTGIHFTDNFMLLFEVGAILRAPYKDDPSWEATSSEFEYEDYRVDVLTFSIGLRYYLG